MKRNLLQAVLGLALVGIVVQVILVAPHAVRDSESAGPKNEKPLGPGNGVDQSLKGMHMIETQQGVKEWELFSDKADRQKDKEILKLAKVRAIFFAKSGVTFTVTGDEGTVEVKTKNMRVAGNVITRSSNGYTFKTAYVDYDSKSKSLSTNSEVEMRGPRENGNSGLKLFGRSMKATLEAGTMDILSQVRAEEGFNKQRLLIHSLKAFFSATHRSARFEGNVVLDMEQMRITAPKAEFVYDSKNEQVQSLVVTGGAKVSDIDKWATADNLKIDFEGNRFTFTGHPRVVQNNDELKGEEIVFLDGGKQVQVHRARAKMDEKRAGRPN